MESCKRLHADFTESEIDGYLSADEEDENRVHLKDGLVDVCIDLRGTAGFFSDDASAMQQAFNTLARGAAWLVMTDHESSPSTDGAQMLYAVGPTPKDRREATIAYGMSLVEPFLHASGIDAKHIEAIKSSLIHMPRAKDTPMLVSLDGGQTYLPSAGVRIIRQNMELDDGVAGEVHLNVTSEGVITDLWAGDDNVGTDSATFDDEIGRLYAPADGPTP